MNRKHVLVIFSVRIRNFKNTILKVSIRQPHGKNRDDVCEKQYSAAHGRGQRRCEGMVETKKILTGVGVTLAVYIVIKYLLPYVIPFLIAYVLVHVLNPVVEKIQTKLRWKKEILKRRRHLSNNGYR